MLTKCKSKRKCIICEKVINKGDICEVSKYGTVCEDCNSGIVKTVSSSINELFPDDECVCPYCKGTGRVNKLKAGELLKISSGFYSLP